MIGFRARVYRVVCKVPAGRVMAYSDVAAALGTPRSARQVGWALAALREGGPGEGLADGFGVVPWQRIILATGELAFRGDPVRGPLQRKLLEQEGVVFSGDKVDMRRYRLPPDELDLTDP